MPWDDRNYTCQKLTALATLMCLSPKSTKKSHSKQPHTTMINTAMVSNKISPMASLTMVTDTPN